MDYPVLIIGAGPSGATTGLLLAHYGIKSLIISRHKSTANTPRAHIFNQRAMEVLRDANIEKRLAPIASPASGKNLYSFYVSVTVVADLLFSCRYAAYVLAE